MNIIKTKFNDLNAIEISTPRARLVAVTDVGPRIAYFGKPKGRNLLFWDLPGEVKRGDWAIRGGHRIWVTRPGADESEEAYGTDNSPCTVRVQKRSVKITAPADKTFGTQKTLTIQVIDEATFEVRQEVRNISSMLWSGGVWALTCTLPKKGTTYGIPLGDHSEWDCFNIVYPKKWAGHSSPVSDRQITITQDCMVVKPNGIMTKRMIQAPQGIIGMTDPGEKVTFIKQSQYIPGAPYPLNTNIAFYVGAKNFMVEMETMAPEITVKPGDSASSQEVWSLRSPVDWGKLKGPLPI